MPLHHLLPRLPLRPLQSVSAHSASSLLPRRSYSTAPLYCPAATSSSSTAAIRNSSVGTLLDGFECMNRNKRWVKKANHGARPCNSRGRKSRTIDAQAPWNVARPFPTHNKTSTYVNPARIEQKQLKVTRQAAYMLKNEEKRKTRADSSI